MIAAIRLLGATSNDIYIYMYKYMKICNECTLSSGQSH